jgi:Pyruvate/2-oxoacid:ferredoxin oxidoreductase delta subunit
MKFIVVAALLALAAANEWTLFNDFVVKYEKKYDSLAELEHRFDVFKQTLVKIARQNAEHIAIGGEAVFGINSLADLTTEEFLSTRVMKNLTYRAPDMTPYTFVMPNGDVDWRTKGVITAVKNQEQCGSCWAHSADEAMESFNAIKYGASTLKTLSVQQCTACTYNYNGCDGGWPQDAYTYAVHDRNGIDLDSDYPYTSGTGNAGVCKFGTGNADKPVADEVSYVSPARGQLQTLLDNTGPVSVCVAAESWQTYTGGILKSCPGSVDHCVQAVGYTTSSAESYWLVRNSWGAAWGYAGYIYLDMTTDNGDICHIQEYMTYPNMA